MTEKLQNYIDGQWVDPSTGEWAENRNPADTRDLINLYPLSGVADMDAAVAAAKAAQPAWAAMPAPARGAIMLEAARLFEQRVDELGTALTREEGKILAEGTGEARKMLNLLEFM